MVEKGVLGDVLEISDCPNLKERLNHHVYKGHHPLPEVREGGREDWQGLCANGIL